MLSPYVKRLFMDVYIPSSTSLDAQPCDECVGWAGGFRKEGTNTGKMRTIGLREHEYKVASMFPMHFPVAIRELERLHVIPDSLVPYCWDSMGIRPETKK